MPRFNLAQDLAAQRPRDETRPKNNRDHHILIIVLIYWLGESLKGRIWDSETIVGSSLVSRYAFCGKLTKLTQYESQWNSQMIEDKDVLNGYATAIRQAPHSSLKMRISFHND